MTTETPAPAAAPIVETPAPEGEGSAIDMTAALDNISDALEKDLDVEAPAETPEEQAARETQEAADKKVADDKKAAEAVAKAAAAAAPKGPDGKPIVTAPAAPAAPAPEIDPTTGKPKIPALLANGLPQEFRTWRPDAQALLLKAQADPALKPLFEEALKREQDMDKGINQYREAAGFADVFRKTLAPFMPLIQHHRLDPLKEVSSLMQARMTLALGTPDQKLAVVRNIIKAAGLDPTVLSTPEPDVSPEVVDLRNRLAAVESSSSQQIEALQTAQMGQLRTELEAFAADPANLYFNDVVARIPALIKSGLAKGYKDAYEMACKLDPIVSAKESQRVADKAIADAKTKADADAAAAAKAKAANVKSSAKNRSAAAPVGSIEDTLKETFREIQNRA